MTKDENQKVVDKKREAYLNNELSHSDYYLWLSDFLEIPGYLVPFRRDELLLSTDPHMNDLSLNKWDSQHIYVSRYAYNKIRVLVIKRNCLRFESNGSTND